MHNKIHVKIYTKLDSVRWFSYWRSPSLLGVCGCILRTA